MILWQHTTVVEVIWGLKPPSLLPTALYSYRADMTKAVAKLRGMSRATLYSVCLPGWLNIRVTSEQHVPWVAKLGNIEGRIKALNCLFRYKQLLTRNWICRPLDTCVVGSMDNHSRSCHLQESSQHHGKQYIRNLCTLKLLETQHWIVLLDWKDSHPPKRSEKGYDSSLPQERGASYKVG